MITPVIESSLYYCHHYEVTVDLGEYPCITAKKLMDAVKRGDLFPMPIFEGDFSQLGSRALLYFPGTKWLADNSINLFLNEVTVIKSTDTSIVLEAGRHFFKGTAKHEVYKIKNRLFYCIIGEGPPEGETEFQGVLNELFGIYVWKQLIRIRMAALCDRLCQHNLRPLHN